MALNSAVTDTQWSPNYSSGRPAGDPTGITAHHWGEDGQNHQGVVDYLCDGNRPGPTSAHYVVSAGRVTQLVHDYDRAWHAGPDGNPRNIGIELRPEMSPGDFETAARLIAAIRAEWGPLPLNKHNDFMNTACPGRWASQLARLSARADAINRGQTTPTAPAKPATPSGLVVDGDFGVLSVKRLQQLLGTTVDGRISGQRGPHREYHVNLLTVDYDDGGSQMVMALQRLLGVTVDGYLGPYTIKALQRRLGVTADGYFGAVTARALQNNLNKGKII